MAEYLQAGRQAGREGGREAGWCLVAGCLGRGGRRFGGCACRERWASEQRAEPHHLQSTGKPCAESGAAGEGKQRTRSQLHAAGGGLRPAGQDRAKSLVSGLVLRALQAGWAVPATLLLLPALQDSLPIDVHPAQSMDPTGRES